ncbi:MAG: multidrug effflux MFS transporter [Rhodobacteraceae bacterium]|nr:multidrug effflux MFS transporter [Paracoccaceae bacterium]
MTRKFLASPEKHPAMPEFIGLMAMMAALVAFSIDAMLPALPQIAADLTPDAPNRAQLVLGAFFLALGLGTLVAGPLSDRFGRRPLVMFGVAIYAAGALWAWSSQSLEALLAARFLQGLGSSGPRVVTMAIARDLYKGAQMARIMSYVMIVFSLVPAMAPLIGAQISGAFGWRAVFLAFIVFAALMAFWFALRQPETLAADARRPVSAKALTHAIKEVFAHPTTRLSILVMTLAMAMLFSTLTSVQQVFDTTYGRGPAFPYYFGAIAIFSTSSGFLNAHLVERLGMRAMIRGILAVQIFLSSLMILTTFFVDNLTLSFAVYVFWTFSLFFQAGMTFGNLNALAMEPMGHIAGLAASVVTSISTIGSMLIAVPLGLAYDGTAQPLAMGVLGMAVLAYFITGKIRRPGEF